ncbi:MAG: RhuM family protein [Flavobacteriales bacterium]
MEEKKEFAIYQTKSGALKLQTDLENDTVWATQANLSFLFEKDQSVISRHIKSIFKDGEVEQKSNMQKMHIANSDKPVIYYSLDIILAVGYRTNSKNAIAFRQWATKTIKKHITQGYTINQNVLESNKKQFLKTLNDLKILTKTNNLLESNDLLSLIETFSDTFFNLENFDKNNFPEKGNEIEIKTSSNELQRDLKTLKETLIKKGEATDLFGQEKKEESLQSIFGAVFQTVFGQDAYPSIEEKAAHLLYFIVKNHPFNDGNKRSGAFAFIWLLQKANYDFTNKINPETLTTLTLLIAISLPEEKEKMVGLILLLLNNERERHKII